MHGTGTRTSPLGQEGGWLIRYGTYLVTCIRVPGLSGLMVTTAFQPTVASAGDFRKSRLRCFRGREGDRFRFLWSPTKTQNGMEVDGMACGWRPNRKFSSC